MAQPALDEVPSSSRAAAAPDGDAAMVDVPSTRPSPSLMPVTSGFQAVNARASTENGRVAGSASSTPQPRGHVLNQSAASPGDAAVAPHLSSQTPPTSTTTASAAADAVVSSKPSEQTDSAAADLAMAESAYGTRSRNRTNARPNYAEDQDNMEFDYNTSVATTTTKKKTATADGGVAAAPAETKRDPSSSVTINGASPAGGSGAGSKDALPGTPNPAPTTKKRKAAAAPSSSTTQSPAAHTPPPATMRKSVAATALPASSVQRETNLMTFTKHKSCLNKKGELVADDGTRLCVNDHVYLVCEPAGDPYYLCRIMEFLHVESDNPGSPIDSIRVNWYYRPRDVQRFSSDSRLVYGTMHSDMCPITSLRGKCTIKHRSEIDDLDAYRKERDSFYFVQVYDRFIKRSYECIPIQQIINVPEKVKKALDERWKFVVVEISRVKELTSAAKACKRCTRYCASHDSVDCAICKNSYHMNCVQPPLPKKPSRGFAWACGPCSRASERKMESRNTPTASGNATEAEEEEVAEEEEGPAASNDTTRAPSPDADDMVIDDHPATQAEIALAKMWPMRYLGIHARVEDALQYDDRAIYPRASSRLGPRHQANVNMWHDHPVELVKPAEIKKRYAKGSTKKDAKLAKEMMAAIEADREEKAKRPKWVQDEPPGYVARGEDYDSSDPRCTATLMFKMPDRARSDAAGSKQTGRVDDSLIDDFVRRAKPLARSIGVPPFGTNFLDKALELLTANDYDVDAALKQLPKMDRAKDLHEPVLTKAELAKFEEAVAKYGSEHRLVRLHMKTSLSHANIVRFYYLWKKTPKGKEIWGNFGGRKKRKIESDEGARLQAEVAHDVDDSAFDNDKAARKNRGFECKFCHTHRSRQWRRAPNVSPGQVAPPDKNADKDKKEPRPLLALCLRCAGLWRKYAIQWEEVDEMAKKIGQTGMRGIKKRIDEELLREIMIANETAANTPPPDQNAATAQAGDGAEPPKKRSKNEKDVGVVEKKKEKPPPPPKEPTPPPPPIIPTQPTWKTLPCAVCRGIGDTVSCDHCKLTVHRRCFGLREQDESKPGELWVCEQCQNDKNPSVSTEYSCCLCLTEETQIDLVEPPRVSHKKKTDREREKERMEKELSDAMRVEHRTKQASMNRPLIPREPLKRTAGNNWVHVYCAVWSPEIRFSDSATFEVAEGFQSIPQSRFEAVCKLCKNKDHQNRVRENAGACVSCFQCHANFHASCAFEAGYQFGFDVTPVKGSRKDQITTATVGQETGLITAAIWCKEHVVKSTIHPIDEVVPESGKNALQIYIENYKQADLALTGTVRKANLAQQTKDKGQQAGAAAQNGNRRESATHGIAAAVRRGARTSSVADVKADTEDTDASSLPETSSSERRCVRCSVDVTPRWHGVVRTPGEDRAGSTGQRLATTLGEVTDHDHGHPNDRSSGNTGVPNGLPSDSSVSTHFRTNGRTWDERYGSRPPTDGELTSLESSAAGMPSLHGPTANGGTHQPPDGTSDGHHGRNQAKAGTATSPPPHDVQPTTEEAPDEYLCHKCFIRKKLQPTPPPEERSERSPLHRYSQQPGTDDNPEQPPIAQTIEEQFRQWDAPPPPPPLRQSQPPPPMHNAWPPMGQPFEHQPGPMGPHPYGPPPPPGILPPGNGFYAPPPHSPQNGHPPLQHGPPPPGVPPGPGQVMHDRHNSFGYPPQQTPHPYPPPQHRPPPLNGYPPANQPIPNGMPSPHGPPHPPHGPPLQSPPYPPPPQHQPLHLNPIGPPHHSGPNAPFGRPNGQPPPMQAGMPVQPPPTHAIAGSPQPAPSRMGSQPPRPSTPRSSGQINGAPPSGVIGGSGASASPNLMNLIH